MNANGKLIIKLNATTLHKLIYRFAFDLTTKILPFFENYFGIRFNLPKIDMVAVPEFGFSAMENWGLITFRSVNMNACQKEYFINNIIKSTEI